MSGRGPLRLGCRNSDWWILFSKALSCHSLNMRDSHKVLQLRNTRNGQLRISQHSKIRENTIPQSKWNKIFNKSSECVYQKWSPETCKTNIVAAIDLDLPISGVISSIYSKVIQSSHRTWTYYWKNWTHVSLIESI